MLTVQMYKVHNHLTNEDVVIPRIVNQQTLDFNALCEYLADGSTVTAADVAAVMKQIEMRLPLVLGLNAKVVCSPEGLTFRPKVSGSITQSQLKAKLEAKLAADPTLDIDVNRALTVSDLAISDLTASIEISIPKLWHERFQGKASFKRVTKSTITESPETTTDPTDGGSDGSTTQTGGGGDSTSQTGGNTPSGGDSTSGDGSTSGGGDGDDGLDKG